MGVVIGDALGMPVQFMNRGEVKKSPIEGMKGYGTYNMPPGTWSDDSSMTLATLDSISVVGKIDSDDILNTLKYTEIKTMEKHKNNINLIIR